MEIYIVNDEFQKSFCLTVLNSYHIKYMFVGDSIKQDIQHYIAGLRPLLQNRLQFIAHGHVREDSATVIP